RAIREAAGEGMSHFVDATAATAALFGSSLAANTFMLGFACQHGALPLSSEALEKAIELNGEAVAMNVAAFRWGRRAAHLAKVPGALPVATPAPVPSIAATLDAVVERRAEFLT